MSMCPNYVNTTLEAGDAATRDNADVWLLLAYVVVVITTCSFSSCVRLPHLSMYARVTETQYTKCTIIIPTVVPWGLFSSTTSIFLGEIMTPKFGKEFPPSFYY